MSANTVLPCATQRSLEKVLCLHSTLQRNATRSRRSKRCCVYTVLPCATQRSLEKVLCLHSTLQRDATVSRKGAVLTQYSPARRNGLSKKCCAYTVLSSATQRSLEKVLCLHSTLQRDATVSRKGAVLTQYSPARRNGLSKRCCAYTVLCRATRHARVGRKGAVLTQYSPARPRAVFVDGNRCRTNRCRETGARPGHAPGAGRHRFPVRRRSALRVAAGEDARNVVEHVRRADLVVAEVAHQATLDDVDLFLGFFVDDGADQRLELDAVLLIFEQLELERAAQAIVGLPVELLAFDRFGADEVHDFTPEIVLAIFRNVDLFFDRPHQAFIGLFVLAGVAVLDLFFERVGLDVVDVVGGKLADRVFVGADRALHLVLHDLFVLAFDHADQVAVALAA